MTDQPHIICKLTKTKEEIFEALANSEENALRYLNTFYENVECIRDTAHAGEWVGTKVYKASRNKVVLYFIIFPTEFFKGETYVESLS